MKMKKIEKTENQFVFSAEISETIMNSIRRYLHQILVMAIDEVEISRNDSPLYDETIAHRLGLVSLKTDKKTTEKSEGKLTLDVKKEGTVYSEELKGKPEVIYKKIPITTLAKGQELQIIATVKAGKGFEHSKFAPGMMYYRNAYEITLDKSLSEEVKKACAESEIKEKGDKIIVLDNKKNEITDVCEGIAKKNKKKSEKKSTGELILTVESFGQMPTEDIFNKSVDALKKDLAEISKQVGKA